MTTCEKMAHEMLRWVHDDPPANDWSTIPFAVTAVEPGPDEGASRKFGDVWLLRGPGLDADLLTVTAEMLEAGTDLLALAYVYPAEVGNIGVDHVQGRWAGTSSTPTVILQAWSPRLGTDPAVVLAAAVAAVDGDEALVARRDNGMFENLSDDGVVAMVPPELPMPFLHRLLGRDTEVPFDVFLPAGQMYALAWTATTIAAAQKDGPDAPVVAQRLAALPSAETLETMTWERIADGIRDQSLRVLPAGYLDKLGADLTMFVLAGIVGNPSRVVGAADKVDATLGRKVREALTTMGVGN